jgi:hypothetical protein
MDHVDNALRASIKALQEVVSPAVDPTDPQAGEQLRLVIHTLEFLRERVDHLHERARFDLRHNLDLATAVAEDAAACSPAVARTLHEAIEAGTALSNRADARTGDVRAGAAGLAAAVRTLVRGAAGADEDARRRIELRVVAATHRRIEVERTWHLPQGFDPDPGSAVPLAAALSAERT